MWANPAYQRYQGKQGVQRSGIENPGNGLADWFVIKHTKDQVLLRYLLSKYGFKAADATQVGIIKNKGKLPFYCVWPAVFKAITVQIQGTRSLPAGVAWFFPLNVWQFRAKVEKVVLVHNSFFICLFESFFFFLFDEFGEPASESSASRKKGKKSIFFFLHPSRVNFVYFHTFFLRWKNPSPEIFLEITEFHSFIVKDFRDSFYIQGKVLLEILTQTGIINFIFGISFITSVSKNVSPCFLSRKAIHNLQDQVLQRE